MGISSYVCNNYVIDQAVTPKTAKRLNTLHIVDLTEPAVHTLQLINYQWVCVYC